MREVSEDPHNRAAEPGNTQVPDAAVVAAKAELKRYSAAVSAANDVLRNAAAAAIQAEIDYLWAAQRLASTEGADAKRWADLAARIQHLTLKQSPSRIGSWVTQLTDTSPRRRFWGF